MISYPNGPAQAKRDRPGAGSTAVEWSPEVVVAYLLGWVVGYVGRLWSVTLARWFRASAGKRPKAGHFPPGTPPALYPDLTRRTRPGATKATPATVTHRLYSTVTDETRDIPTYSPQARPQSWSPTPETQTHPRRRLVSQPGNRTQATDPGPTRPPSKPSWNVTPRPQSAHALFAASSAKNPIAAGGTVACTTSAVAGLTRGSPSTARDTVSPTRGTGRDALGGRPPVLGPRRTAAPAARSVWAPRSIRAPRSVWAPGSVWAPRSIRGWRR